MTLATRLLRGYAGGTSVITDWAGLINGCTSAAYLYAIGPISSSDAGLTWTAGASAVITPTSGWKSIYVKDPSVVWDGSQFVVYYCGWDGSNFQVGRATAPAITGPWTDYGSNPILGVPNDGGWRASGALFPFVVYNAADSPAWRMWVAGSNAGVFTVGYLSSSDGLTWTDHGRVLNVGTAGAQDDLGILTPAALRVGSTWHVYYAGYKSSTGFMRSMHATCTDPADAGTYTKTGVLAGYDARISVGGWDWRSNAVRQLIPSGSGYSALVDFWNPGGATGAPTDTEESCVRVYASDPVTLDLPTGLMIPLGSSWYANSAENPSVVPLP